MTCTPGDFHVWLKLKNTQKAQHTMHRSMILDLTAD